jgi:hypothetical protein
MISGNEESKGDEIMEVQLNPTSSTAGIYRAYDNRYRRTPGPRLLRCVVAGYLNYSSLWIRAQYNNCGALNYIGL